MIEKELKKVELSPLPTGEAAFYRLDSADGRDTLAKRIHADIDEWCQKQYDDGPRSHLGASILGHECERYIWFSFRWMFREVFSGRMQRLFQRGHLEETRVIEWLTGIGFTVHQVDQDNKQFHVAFGEGHGGGSTDGIGNLPIRYGLNYPSLLVEIKTQKDKRWDVLKGSGMQKEKPRHFVQASVYGRLLGLQYCLYVAVNKEDDDLDVEIVELDWSLADAELAKAERIINATVPPPRISENASFWMCKYCAALQVCHLGAHARINCRSCRYAEPVAGKEWKCNYYQSTIPKKFIPLGCSNHVPIPK